MHLQDYCNKRAAHLFCINALAAIGYFALGKVGLQFTLPGPQVAAIWPPTGFDIFVLFCCGLRCAPGIALGSLALQLHIATPLPQAIVLALSDVVECAVPVMLLLHLKAARDLVSVRSAGYYLLAAMLGTAINSTAGNLTIALSSVTSWRDFAHLWIIWWAANLTGALIVAPVLFSLVYRDFSQRTLERPIELGILYLFTAGLGSALFLIRGAKELQHMEYVLLACIAWAGLRFGVRGTVWIVAMICAFGMIGTLRNTGPFSEHGPQASLMLFQMFVCTCAVSGMVLASAVEERSRAIREVVRANVELETRVAERTRELSEAAMTDALTGLPNRSYSLELLSRAIGRMRRHPEYTFAVLFIDLDRFKTVNDSLGHSAGDRLLIEVASRLRQCIRQQDCVARLGGDEFVIFLDDLSPTDYSRQCAKVSERILAAVSRPIMIADQEVSVNASIGVALSTSGYDMPQDLLRDADTAMYRAKKSGPGRVEIFDPQMHENAMQTLWLEQDLRKAVQHGEMSLQYQPLINLATQRLIGFEALARWTHPQKGPIAPAVFIPVAEETGIIVPLGAWVLREAISRMADWQRHNQQARSLMISINTSAAQLAQPGFVENVHQVLKDSGLAPGCLKLEITESAIIQHPDIASERMERLRELGVEFLVDDFGTGYSSLGYLARLPIDALKIDRCFISGPDPTNTSREIVRCVVAVAQSLGIQTIAEGIEDIQQAKWLEEMNCTHGQGYLYSKPLDFEAARQFAEERFAQQASV